jgi:hypothetical protein
LPLFRGCRPARQEGRASGVWFDLTRPVRHNPGVMLHRLLAAALLVLAFGAVPELLWLGAHSVGHHEHHEHSADRPELAKALFHGHEHAKGEPEHEHHPVPSSPVRHDPPQEAGVPDIASSAVAEPARPQLASTASWQETVWPSGSSPPLLHLLCTLLI